MLARGYVVTPNLGHPAAARLGRWEPEHGDDCAFVSATVAFNPDRAVRWHAEPHYYEGPAGVGPRRTDPRPATSCPRLVDRREFARHADPHQAVMLRPVTA